MSPQIGAGFNRAGGAWYKLEELEVKLASHYGKLYSVSGPIFQDQLGTIGENKITIPGYFFKAFLLPDYKAAVGFIVRHEITSRGEFAFAVTIDSLEAFTHIDFYPALADDVEHAVESTIDLAYWSKPNEKPDVQKSTQTCRATTKSGVRCKRVVNDADYCCQHLE